MRDAFAFELFDGLVKDYGVCVWTYAFALKYVMRLDLCVWTYAFGYMLLFLFP